ncbi:MAG: thermosome subunit alpha [Methanomicrobiales archaeon]
MQSPEEEKPVFILKEGTERTEGKDAQRENISAARAVAQAIRTTLGPLGMDKMLVDSIGDVVITNDGATILEEMEIQHPAARMMVEVAKAQDDEVGDGTTAAVVLAGELLREAEEQLDQNMHPTTIAAGYLMAAEKAREVLDRLSSDMDGSEDTYRAVATTAMTGKGAGEFRNLLADLVVRAAAQVRDEDGWVDVDAIKVEQKEGGAVEDSTQIDGLLIDKEPLHPDMPEMVEDARVLLINAPIELQTPETDAEITIQDPTQLDRFLAEEEAQVRETVKKVVESGANVLFSQKGIDETAERLLADAGILAARRVKKSDLEKLAAATGATVVNTVDDIEAGDLGFAGQIACERIAGEKMIAVTRCRDPRAVTLLIRGGTRHVVEEIGRAINDALQAVVTAMNEKKMVPGGGASEMEVAAALRQYAQEVGGRQQISINAFASAIEAVPRTIAENAGLDPVDTFVALRNAHAGGESCGGIDVDTGAVVDMVEQGVVEPLTVKSNALTSAADAAIMVLRIDDVISSGEGGGGGEMPPEAMGGMPGGMPPGGMPPGMM